jgi:hypothetical protein
VGNDFLGLNSSMTLVASVGGRYGLKCEDSSLGTGPNLFLFVFARGGEYGGVCCRAGLGGVDSGRGSAGSSSRSGRGGSASTGSSWSGASWGSCVVSREGRAGGPFWANTRSLGRTSEGGFNFNLRFFLFAVGGPKLRRETARAASCVFSSSSSRKWMVVDPGTWDEGRMAVDER